MLFRQYCPHGVQPAVVSPQTATSRQSSRHPRAADGMGRTGGTSGKSAQRVGPRYAKTVETEPAALREYLLHMASNGCGGDVRHFLALRGPPWSLERPGRVACLQPRQPAYVARASWVSRRTLGYDLARCTGRIWQAAASVDVIDDGE